MTPTIEQVRKEPCWCVICGACNGNGIIWDCIWDLDSESEPCEYCTNGISKVCDRCTLLADLERDEEGK